MAVVLTNNAVSRLASSLTSGATALSVTAGEGAKFPSLSAGKWFPVTLIKASGALEILRCTARSGDVLTVVRAQEGTAAQAFAVGDRAELRITAAALAEFKQISEISAFMLGMLDDPDAEAARISLQLGNAALRNAASSYYAPATGEVLIDGTYGLGKTLAAVIVGSLNDTVVTCFMRCGINTTDGPTSVNIDGATVIHQQWSTSFASQIMITINGAMYRRVKQSGNWPANWTPIRDAANTPISAIGLTLIAAADAAAAKAAISVVEGPGVGQTWQNVTASRAVTTIYTNSTGKPIVVSVAWNQVSSNDISLLVAGVRVSYGSQTNVIGGSTVQAIVPPSATYQVTGSNTISTWMELR